MMYLSDKQLDEVLSKMFEAVGKEFKSIKKSCSTNEWYMKYSWTEKEEKEFDKWLKFYLIKNLHMSSLLANQKSKMFCFMWGWRYKSEDKSKG